MIDLFSRFFERVERVDLSALDLSDDGLSHGIRRGEIAFVMSVPRGIGA